MAGQAGGVSSRPSKALHSDISPQRYHLLPSGCAFDPSTTQPTWITGIPMVDSLLEGNYPYFLSALAHVILPSLALGLSAFGIVTRVVRSSLLDVMRMNYIRTARARGL